ncbi:MAG TPA: hypothetical protein VGQ76_09755 [Thermoanaerobaculia bacterium]|jgi:hypothetical protein|nr:hypothetical protein [Thermoanaerobaculia bacterium]
MLSSGWLHSATVLAPIAYLLIFIMYRDWTQETPKTVLPNWIARARRSLRIDPSRLILLNVLWPGLGLITLGEQLFGTFAAVFHLLVLSLWLLERGPWELLALVSIMLNYAISLGVTFKLVDLGKRFGSSLLLRFGTSD